MKNKSRAVLKPINIYIYININIEIYIEFRPY
jgi:hypothetical protein